MPLDLPLREARDAFERAYFEYHLAQENGSMTRVAEKTGLERTHLYRKLKQLGIELNKSAAPLTAARRSRAPAARRSTALGRSCTSNGPCRSRFACAASIT